MYRDKTLIPSEAIRMLALGILAQAPTRYAALASEVRHFATRIVGPSLDILGSSIELLRYEGLIEATEGEGLEDDALLRITEAGRASLGELLRSNVRAPIDDINKLVIAGKMRFLHVLASEDQREQLEALVELYNTELARLEDLKAHHTGEPGHLVAWLEHDIGQLQARIDWLEELRDGL
ncbi:MAG: hypothetical protein QNJ94_08780 [Alphaproteobacteria bacterium]|nr:hypothetical protein [Alphaproteobacteria bacterium]